MKDIPFGVDIECSQQLNKPKEREVPQEMLDFAFSLYEV